MKQVHFQLSVDGHAAVKTVVFALTNANPTLTGKNADG